MRTENKGSVGYASSSNIPPPTDRTQDESIAGQLDKTTSVLNRVLELVDTLRGRVSGCAEGASLQPPKAVATLASQASENRELAEEVHRKLNEIAADLFGKI